MRRLAPLLALLLMAQAPLPPPVPPPVPASPSDNLLNALRAAPNEAAAAALEAQLRMMWRDAASPALKLLLARGQRELSENAAGEAVDSFDAALDLDPNLLEARRGRAQARLRLGDPAGAIRDIQEALHREPRNFAAWMDLSRIAEARGDWRGALAAWQKMLEITPRSPGAQDRLRDLRRRAEGEAA